MHTKISIRACYTKQKIFLSEPKYTFAFKKPGNNTLYPRVTRN